ncbi:Lipoprotein-anchoring transpeptidase ErfK/SrfK [Saccharopolyspora antimicrobica]|uniref:Lipoprotein-anchoring transpeptidase ErfK/SrfK n=1 Tax=Saccharopolyspora antimicrobica TaxID=455193 RepID=A0A1I4QGB1_9PSEU|nr:Ig-like domain-containing protein [Saccharopolyspora antimicrobica]RKT84908.1 lipoprotein-anchoring transpeptidase ErfK/SrfK [Saccharopolyspora antimicrobica]SFM38690.1 Lipoprotein-anchoring transpeptidase ErfK/SrfK [Saccharopolyspora antimicrobica]
MSSKLRLLWTALAAVLLISGCGTSAPEDRAPAEPVAKVSFEPGAGAAEVNPAVPVKAGVERGRFDSVQLTNAEGKQVEGQLAPDGKSWQATTALGYGKTYTWSGQATGEDGKQVPVQGSFTTLQPQRTIRATINPTDEAEVGIAMPISVKFDEPVQDKAAVQRALNVQTSVPVEGAWAWLSDRQVDWRPKEYWPANTRVSVSAKLYGLAYGGGAYGLADLTTDFDIGRAQIVKADVNTHRLVVLRDGEQVASYAASYGEEYDPGRNTPNGTFIIMEKNPVEIMDNPRYGYRDVRKTWAARFSNHGEFIHENQENAAALGKVNNSHGCINLSAADAKKYYDSALIGDPVEVSGSASSMPPQYDVYDWLLSWDQWQAKSAA